MPRYYEDGAPGLYFPHNTRRPLQTRRTER